MELKRGYLSDVLKVDNFKLYLMELKLVYGFYSDGTKHFKLYLMELKRHFLPSLDDYIHIFKLYLMELKPIRHFRPSCSAAFKLYLMELKLLSRS